MGNKGKAILSMDTVADTFKMVVISLTFSLITSLWLTPVQGSTVPNIAIRSFTDGSEDKDDDDDDDDDDDGGFNYRYMWPFLFSAIVAAVFAAIYSCTKRRKCCRKQNSEEQQESASSDPQPPRRRHFTNSAFVGDNTDFGRSPPYPGASVEPTVVEMQPPPYCEKPPDYVDIFPGADPVISDMSSDNTSPDNTSPDNTSSENTSSDNISNSNHDQTDNNSDTMTTVET